MTRVDVTDDAVADLLAATAQVLAGGSLAGERFVRQYEDALLRLREFPGSGHRHRSLVSRYRVVAIGDWLMIHEELEDRVIVHRILHGSADLRSFRP